MSYRNPIHGLNSSGDPEPDIDPGEPGVTLPRMTADTPDALCPDRGIGDHDEHQAGPTLADPGHLFTNTQPPADGWVPLGVAPPPDAHTVLVPEDGDDVVVLDMAYLMQRALERMAADGRELPEGITVESLARWRAEHPDYDPVKPLAGMPLPADVQIEVAGRQPARNLPAVLPPITEDARRFLDQALPAVPAHGDVAEAELVDPGARCLASTGAPVDEARRCPVHADGAHRCYQGPGHQGAKALSPVVMARCEHVVPESATHTCDCDFRWTHVVQVPA